MSAITPNKSYGVGFRYGQIMLRDADGYPKATSTDPYYGLWIDSGKELTVNDPDVRRITHTGRDTVVETDVLPPNEALTMELQVAGSDFDLDAALTGLKVFTEGESKRLLVNTNLKGYEKDVIALFYQQSTVGGRRWRYFASPSGVIVPRQIGFNDQNEVRTYPITPHICTFDEYGVALTVLTHGATKAQLITGLAKGIPTWCAFLADGAETDFLFDVDKPARDAASVVVKVDGAVVVAGITPSLTKVTYSVAPASGKKICVYYEQ